MDVTYEFKWNEKTKKGLNKVPDDILCSIAKQTLDMAISKEYIPIGKTSNLKNSSAKYGVHKSTNNMTIGSTTDYARHVWNMDQKTTNWTNKPHSKSKWYVYTLKKHGKLFIDTAINRAWKEDM